MKVVFLDFDGVLNSLKFMENESKNGKMKKDGFYFCLKDFDVKKVMLVRELCEKTDSKIVVTSSWKKMKKYPLIKGCLIVMGLPIIGETNDYGSKRGKEIKEYLLANECEDYIVVDDEIFKDYDKEILSRLVKTSFYEDGFEEKHLTEAINLFDGNELVRKYGKK